MKPYISDRGYYKVQLNIDGKQYQKRLHRLLAESFIENPKNYPQINHIDGNKLNNRLENLEWCTNKKNIQHSIALGLKKMSRGKLHHIYEKKDSKYVVAFKQNKKTVTVGTFRCLTDAIRERDKFISVHNLVWLFY